MTFDWRMGRRDQASTDLTIAPLSNDVAARLHSRDRWFGYGVWFVFFVVVSALISDRHTVTHSYWGAAQNWLAGEPLYNGSGHGFIYLPQSAVLFVPLTLLPPLLCEIVWRFLTIGIFAWGLKRLAATGEQRLARPLFGLATLIAIPMAATCARNGQATLLIAGLMMAAVALAGGKHWWCSAACLVLAVAIKPIALPLLLLLAAMHRPLIGRLMIGLALAAILPSLTQTPSYVQAQYLGCYEMFSHAAQIGNDQYFAQLSCLLKMIGCPVSASAMTSAGALCGVLLLALCLCCRPQGESSRWAIHFYALSTAYLLLFNARTENSTYAMLGPAIGLSIAQALFIERRPGHAAFLSLLAAGMLGSYEIGRIVTGPERAVWLNPLMTIFFAVDVTVRMIAEGAAQFGRVSVPARSAERRIASRRFLTNEP